MAKLWKDTTFTGFAFVGTVLIMALLMAPLPAKGLMLILFAIALAYATHEVVAALQGEKQWHRLIEARTTVYQAREMLERDFKSRASNASFGHEMWPEQREAIVILWQCCDRINADINELDLPFWRKPR